MDWNKETIRTLRLRLGWSQSDLARRLRCEIQFIESWEAGDEEPTKDHLQDLELILHQAEACSSEVYQTPLAEKKLDQDSLIQVNIKELDMSSGEVDQVLEESPSQPSLQNETNN